ncbi:MAG: leucine-rich repeat protein [Clostridiales Family XIII bacterium]|nr:leucine-rich repeat protein [Clostridiales Family XIII bacterium]
MSNTRFLSKAAALLLAVCLVFALCAQMSAGAWASEGDSASEETAGAEAAPAEGSSGGEGSGSSAATGGDSGGSGGDSGGGDSAGAPAEPGGSAGAAASEGGSAPAEEASSGSSAQAAAGGSSAKAAESAAAGALAGGVEALGDIEPLDAVVTIDGVQYHLMDYPWDGPGRAVLISYMGGNPYVHIEREIHLEDKTYMVEEISDHAFQNTGVAEIDLRDAFPLRRIGSYAFANCASLQRLMLTTNVQDVGEKILENANSNAEVYLYESYSDTYASVPASWNPAWSEGFSGTLNGVPVGSTQSSGFAYTVKDDGTLKLDRYIGGDAAEVTIPAEIDGKTVTELAANLFYYNYNAFTGNITVPASVQIVPSGAFNGTTGDIYLPFAVDAVPAGWSAYWASGAEGRFYFNGTLVAAILIYTLNSDGAGYTVEDISNNPVSAEIPAVWKGKPVTAIGAYAFNSRSRLTSVTIPSSVTSIGNQAFSESGLTAIDIPSSVTSIGTGAFYYCRSLAQVTGGEGLTSIGNSSFGYTAITSFPLPDTITTIEPYVFTNCTNLASVTIPDSVTSIGTYAFYGCSNLASVTLPGGLTSIGNTAFCFCTSLTSITLPASLTSIGTSAFSQSGLTGITIPIGVTTMGSRVFYGLDMDIYCEAASKPAGWASDWISGCTGTVYWAGAQSGITLTYSYSADTDSYTVTGASGEGAAASVPAVYDDNAHGVRPVTAIGAGAFQGLSRITSVTIGANVQMIGNQAFRNLTTLKTVTFEEGSALTSIGDSAFYEAGITSLILPDGVQSIGTYAFYRCVSLTEVTLPEGLTSVGSAAFSQIAVTSIDVPGSLETLPSFGTNLTSITLHEGLKTIPASLGNTKIQSIHIPASVESIGYNAFTSCFYLETVTFAEGSNLASIGDSAFASCSALTEISLPDSLTTIGRQAFSGSNAFARFDIPIGVASVGASAFSGDSFDIYCAAAAQPAGWDAKWNSGHTGTVYWNGTAGIETTEDGYRFVLNADGAGYTLALYDGKAFQSLSSMQEVTLAIPGSFKDKPVTAIADGAFTSALQSNRYGLIHLSIPASVKTIGASAFSANSGGISYTSGGITPLSPGDERDYSGYTWGAVVSVAFGEGSALESIGSYAFASAAITEIAFPQGLRIIGNDAFEYASLEGDLDIPASVTSIGSGAFEGCWRLQKVTLHEGLGSIGSYAFAACYTWTSDQGWIYGLSEINIPLSVETIGAYAFRSNKTTIYCAAAAKPDGWASNWTGTSFDGTVIWGVGGSLTDAQAVAADRDALTWDTIKAGNTAQTSVTGDLSLAAAGANETSIAWAASPAGYVAADGQVTRPTYTQGDQSVTLTATITKGEASATRTFAITILRADRNDEESVAGARDALTWALIANGNAAQNNVTGDLNLLTAHTYGTSVSWASSKPEYIAGDGQVTRPSWTQGSLGVILTATITKGEASATKTFSVTVTALPISDQEAVSNVAANRISWNAIRGANASQDAVTADLNLAGATDPTYGTTITWSSSDEAVVAADGQVTRPDKDTGDLFVTLTATVTKGEAVATKALTVKVLSEITDNAAVLEVVTGLSWDTIKGENNIEPAVAIYDLVLPTGGDYETTITWSSDMPDVIEVDGTVVRPGEGTPTPIVTLTAIVGRNGVEARKTFNIYVRPVDTAAPAVAWITPQDGASIGPSSKTVRVRVTDATAIDTISVQYKVGDGGTYTEIAGATAVGTRSKELSAALPVGDLSHGDEVYVQISAADVDGNALTAHTVTYTVDKQVAAPLTAEANVDNAASDGYAQISWTAPDDADITGFSVYQNIAGRGWTLAGQVARQAGVTAYSVKNYSISKEALSHTFRVESFDRVGNTAGIEADAVMTPNRTQPEAYYYGERTVEATFAFTANASYSQHYWPITAYSFDFGDGTPVVSGASAVVEHTYAEPGDYTLTLTVTDSKGQSDAKEFAIQAVAPDAAAKVEVTVKAAGGGALPGVPVFFDLGSEAQVYKTSDGSGKAVFSGEPGIHTVGSLGTANDYLPAEANVTLVAGQVAQVTLTLEKEPIVEGEFEIHKMTLEEILDAGIDVSDPENHYIAEITFYLFYEEQVFSGGGVIVDTEYRGGGFAGPSGDVIYPQVIVTQPGEGAEPIVTVAYLEIPATVSALKDFYDVKLHILNNADEAYSLLANTVTLNVPDGLTIMDTQVSAGQTVTIPEIAGQSEEVVRWILRGDQIGEYEISADYTGTVDVFNWPLSAQFLAPDKIVVEGLTGLEARLDISDIVTHPFYYNLSLINNSDRDIYYPDIASPPVNEEGVELILYASEHFTAAQAAFADTLNTGQVLSDEGYASELPDGLTVLHPGEKIVRHYRIKMNNLGPGVPVDWRHFSFQRYYEGVLRGKAKLTNYYAVCENAYGLEVTIYPRDPSWFSDDYVEPPEEGMTDEEAVAADADALTWDAIRGENTAQDAVTGDLALPAAGENGTAVSWASTDTAAVATDGTVTRPAASAGDSAVTLTATVTKGEASATKTFVLKVKAEPPVVDPEAAVITVGTPTGPYRAGEQVVVPVRIEKNPGFISLFFEVAYDEDVFSIAEMDTAGGVLDGTSGLDGEGSRWFFVSLTPAEGDGLLFNIVFDIAEDAPAGGYDITIGLLNGDADMFIGLNEDEEEYSIPVSFVAGEIEVADLETPTAADLDYDLPKTVTYTGAAQAVAVGKKTAGIGDVTVWYAGTGGTVYEKSQTPPVDVGTYQVSADVADARANGYAAAEGIALGTLTVAKAAAPVITWPVASAITYGDTLADAALTGGSTEYGSFAWTDDTICPSAPGGDFEVTFTPSEATEKNYETITDLTEDVHVTVNKAGSITVTYPSASAIRYGQTLADSALTGGSTEYGTFAWTDGSIAPAVPGGSYGVTFTPSDETLANYEGVTNPAADVAVVVEKAIAPSITWPSASAITYGQTIGDSTLTGGTEGYGTFGWAPSVDTDAKPGAGSVLVDVAFTPSEETLANYEEIGTRTQPVILIVNKAAAPAIEWPSASAITYGQKIGDAELTGGTEGYGTFGWADSVNLDWAPDAGSYPVLVEFTPSAGTLANYEPISPLIKAVTLVVDKAEAPEIEWPVASAITYGQAVSASTLSGGTEGYGSFDWAPGVDVDERPDAGTYSLEVVFTPSEGTLANYEAVSPLTRAVTLLVNKAPAPAITWPTASAINEGQPLSASTLTPASNAYGTFAWTDGTIEPAAPGGAYEVTFTQTNENYEPVTPAVQDVDLIVVALPGDSNGDGKLDARDATMALRAAMGLATLTPAQFAAIDLDKDGVITAADATNVARLVAGLAPKF